jgi:hypothetical protein
MKKLLMALLMVASISEINAQAKTSELVELAKFKNTGKSIITNFSYNDEAKTTKFALVQKGKNLVVLKNLTTNKIVEQYKQIPPPKNLRTLTCEEQRKQQEDTFRINILPKYISEANKTCRSFQYCHTYYCDGDPSLFVLYLINPTNRRCLKVKEMNVKLEKLRYSFDLK